MSISSFGMLPGLNLVQESANRYSDVDFVKRREKQASSSLRPVVRYHEHEAGFSDFSDLWSVLLALSEGNDCPVIMFNSPEDGYLSAKLIRQVARLFSLSGGKEVLAIDGNLRRPLLHERFELPNGAGLSCYLDGARAMEDVVVKTRFPRVDLIRSGHKAEDVVSLLMSQRFPDLIADVKERYDLILINSMAYGDCVDAFIVAKFLRPVLAFHGTPAGREAVAEAEEDMAVLECNSMKYIR
jgi:Mrp family chromosome partitioning ATPase